MEARREFYGHLSSYIAVNVMLWSIYLATGSDSPWPLWVTVGWGFGMFGHAWDYWTTHGPGRDYIERQNQAEIERELAAYYARDEKRKNDIYIDEPIGIGPDGELLYADDMDEKAKRG